MENLRFKILILLVITSMALGACNAKPAPTPPDPSPSEAQPVTETVGPKSGGAVSIISSNLPIAYGNFKEASWQPGLTAYTFPAVETLVGMTKHGPAPTKLATGWEVAPDGSSITFELRKGVKFHDGTDFNADAVKWNLEVIKELKKELQIINSIDVVDTHTVRLNLSEYSNTLLYNLAWYDGCMISPDSYVGRDAEYIATHLIGTGPFVVASFTQDTKVTFKKFDEYWDEGKPYLNELEYIMVKDVNTARNALLTGQAQAWDYVPLTEIAALKEQGYSTNICPGLIRIGYSDSANPNSPFFKKEVRYALEHAIDKQAIAETFGAGTYGVPVAPCAPDIHIGGSAVTKGRGYDPAKAKQLLGEAGYPKGFKTTLYSQAATNPDMLAAIQGYLLAVGIDAELQIVDSAKMNSLRREGWENGVLVQGLSTANPNYIQALEADGPSPQKATSALVTPEYSEQLKKASKAIEPDDIEEQSKQLAKLTFDEAVITPFVIESRVCVYDTSVHDLDLSAFSIWFWNPGEVWME